MLAKKWLCSAFVLVLIFGLLAGCTTKKDAATTASPADSATAPSTEAAPSDNAASSALDTSKEVKLKMILVGDKPADTDLVYAELNKKLKQDINATVSVQFISFSDLTTKYPLILASGEDYDLIQAANWDGYFNNARNGAFHEITQADLDKYMPQTAKNTPKEVMDASLVNGKWYAFPMNYHEITINGMIVRGDMMKKYNIPDLKTSADFGSYLDAVKKNEPGMIPWGLNANALGDSNAIYGSEVITNFDKTLLAGQGEVKLGESKPQISSIYEDPNTLNALKLMQNWANKGYWSKSAIVDKTTSKDQFINGKSAAYTDNLLQANATFLSLKQSHPDWDLRFYPIAPDHKYLANPFINNGTAINAKSQNYERALMFVDLLRNDAYYNQLTTYGIKGKHWDLSADGKLVSLPDSKNYPPDAAGPWGWRDERFYLSPSGGLANYDEVMKNAQAHTWTTNINAFSFDNTNVKSIEAALTEVSTQYLAPLQLGLVKKSVEEDLKVAVDKLKAAGLDKYLAEMQKQLDSFQVTVD